jgi:hypothetical protein
MLREFPRVAGSLRQSNSLCASASVARLKIIADDLPVVQFDIGLDGFILVKVYQASNRAYSDVLLPSAGADLRGRPIE